MIKNYLRQIENYFFIILWPRMILWPDKHIAVIVIVIITVFLTINGFWYFEASIYLKLIICCFVSETSSSHLFKLSTISQSLARK